MASSFSLAPSVRGRLWSFQAQFIKPHHLSCVLALAALLLQSLLLLPIPLLQGWILDRLVALPSGEWNGTDLKRMIGAVLAASVACLLGRTALAWSANATMIRVSLEIVRELTDAIHRKLQRLPVAYYDREQTGRVMSRITSDVGSLLIFLSSASLQLVSDLVLALGIAAVLLWLHWELAAVAFLAVPLYALNHRMFVVKVRAVARRVRGHVAGLYAFLSERLSAVRVVRSFAQEEAELAELDRRIDAHRAETSSGLRVAAFQGGAALFITGLATVAVLAYGVLLMSAGMLSVGEFLAFYALTAQLYLPIVRLLQFQGTVSATMVAVERIIEVLDEPETVTDRAGALPIARPGGSVTFENVFFGYNSGAAPALKQVNLHIEPGTKVAIVGPSGSGKSTLLALAPRLYEVGTSCGRVLFDGRDVGAWRLAELRRAVTLVPQQAVLFEGTIRSNLTYARPDAKLAALERALEITDLAGLIRSLPLGLDTPVGERGFTLSGGQRQRLALARALIADPAVLLLDDCLSALDVETEARILAALEPYLVGRTCVTVSHKLGSVRGADVIIVMAGGRIIERGNHDELMTRCGYYAAMNAADQKQMRTFASSQDKASKDKVTN